MNELANCWASRSTTGGWARAKPNSIKRLSFFSSPHSLDHESGTYHKLQRRTKAIVIGRSRDDRRPALMPYRYVSVVTRMTKDSRVSEICLIGPDIRIS